MQCYFYCLLADYSHFVEIRYLQYTLIEQSLTVFYLIQPSGNDDLKA